MFKGMDYIYEVYRERNFTRAAENLYISQPSLSASVHRIEEKVGYPIFDRGTKPLELTEVGKHYIKTVERIREMEEEFTTYLNDLGTLKKGTLNLGGSNFFSSWVLPPIIADFSKQYPELDINLTEANSVELIQELKEAQLDFVIDNKDVDPKVFESYSMGQEQLLLVVPGRFEVNEKLKGYQVPRERILDGSFAESDIPAVDLNVFEDYPFIVLNAGNDTGKRAYGICQEYRFHPKVILELDQQLTAYNVASSGAGITFSGELLISRVPDNPNLHYYKLNSINNTREIQIYWKKGKYMSQAMNAFLNYLKNRNRLTKI